MQTFLFTCALSNIQLFISNKSKWLCIKSYNFKNKKERKTTKFSVKTTAGCVLCVLFMLMDCTSKQEKAGQRAKIIFLSGEVSVDSHKAELGMAVKPGAVVRTGPQSSCEIVFNNKNIIKILEGSKAIPDLKSETKRINLKMGAVASVVKNLGRATGNRKYKYEITTPTSVAGVRGTLFFVKVEDNDNTYICVCNGVIEIGDLNGKNQKIIEAAHHNAIRVTRKEDRFVETKPPMSYHTDEDMEKVAEKIGLKIDWNTTDRDLEQGHTQYSKIIS